MLNLFSILFFLLKFFQFPFLEQKVNPPFADLSSVKPIWFLLVFFQDPPPALVLLQPDKSRQHEHHGGSKHHFQHRGQPAPTAALEQQRRCSFLWSTSDSISAVCASVPFTTRAFVTMANNHSRPQITCSTRPAAALALPSLL